MILQIARSNFIKAWCVLLISGSTAMAQLPVEVFGGQKKSTLDIMFFRFIKKNDQTNSPWLYFHRNRATADYRMTTTNYLPVLSSTEAISWNHQSLKGIAPVFTLQFLQRGLFPKAGVQYALTKEKITVFTWLVYGIKNNTDPDYFLLLRYSPKLTQTTKLFTQLELVNSFAFKKERQYNFIQRARIGITKRKWNLGAGIDLQQTGRTQFEKTANPGLFIRHEF